MGNNNFPWSFSVVGSASIIFQSMLLSVQVSLAKGDSVMLYKEGTTPDVTIREVPGNPEEYNWWGYHAHPKTKQKENSM